MMSGRREDETSTSTWASSLATPGSVAAYALAIARAARLAAELEREDARRQAARDAYRRAAFDADDSNHCPSGGNGEP